jgi:hypothetical protein
MESEFYSLLFVCITSDGGGEGGSRNNTNTDDDCEEEEEEEEEEEDNLIMLFRSRSSRSGSIRGNAPHFRSSGTASFQLLIQIPKRLIQLPCGWCPKAWRRNRGMAAAAFFLRSGCRRPRRLLLPRRGEGPRDNNK